MMKTIRLLLALSVVLGVAACAEPYPVYYFPPPPPPLQPYMGPVAVAPAPVKHHYRKRHHRRHHYRKRRVHCRCVPVR